MNLTPRDKWMCAVLPALLTGIVCQIAFTRPLARESDALAAQIQKQGPLAVRKAALKQAENEHDQLEDIIAAKRKSLAGGGAAGGSETGFNRTVTLQQISKLCETGGLTLMSSAPEPGAKLPPSVDAAAKVLVKPAEASAPQVWRLELRGSYTDMLEFLDGLAAVSSLVVPLTVGMQPDADENNPISWTLSIWL